MSAVTQCLFIICTVSMIDKQWLTQWDRVTEKKSCGWRHRRPSLHKHWLSTCCVLHAWDAKCDPAIPQ